jgi:hypothetical protein
MTKVETTVTRCMWSTRYEVNEGVMCEGVESMARREILLAEPWGFPIDKLGGE